MKYIAYIRKSTDDKKRQVQSMANQLEWINRTSKQLGLEILEIFKDKRTASEPGREGFKKMMNLIQKCNEPIGIICWKMHRLARNPIDEGAIKYAFIQSKIKHIYASDRQFREGENQILMGVEFGAATQYTLDLKTSVDFGMKRKIESGYRPTLAPLGYINDKYAVTGKKKIYKDPKRFNALQQAWQKLLTGAYSVEEIRKELNRKGFVGRNSRPLVKSYLYKMFSNTFYAGYYNWQGKTYKGKHPRMVSLDDFKKVQVLLGKKPTTRAYKNEQLFSGIMICGECGYGITSEDHTKTIKSTGNKKTYTYLRCTKKNPVIRCNQKYLSLAKAEKQIDTIFKGLQLPDYFLDWFCELHSKQQKKDTITLGHEKAALQKKINDNKYMMQQLMDNLNRSIVDEEQYTENMARYKEKALLLDEQLIKLGTNNRDWIEQLKNDFHFANTVIEQYKNGTKDTKRKILTSIGSNWILQDKRLLVDLLPPFELFNKLHIFHHAKTSPLELGLSYSENRKAIPLLHECSWWLPLWEEVRTFYWQKI